MNYENIVILTGAGISAESGLKTFRDNDGLWENHRVEDVATPEAFIRNPRLVYTFYNQRRAQLQMSDVKPNLAHLALAKLEAEHAGNVTIVTQNVDNLHEQAGSKQVLHMHGELLSARCTRSGKSEVWTNEIDNTTRCSCCNSPSSLRPDIVWFGEMPLYLDEISEAIANADLFISIGTSGTVYPAAGFVSEAKFHNVHTVELNLEPTGTRGQFDEGYYGPASAVVPHYIHDLLKESI
ncbi:NAD-dependent protein deacylase [Aestuariibacter sp. AA17]|uniref:NAD-dependent protein deacylase n=1 Tax=Fluctibacter corallii TaxID=2984329 RepID=A0ABT3A6N1_9ALTE|nr:Sir2 family NAD+-dependent deacetylase [Aestuariibacter sp. AA17]MCV2884222.1 NAD-dependent protein deacylase [Aestuariibacter sp. AA17]